MGREEEKDVEDGEEVKERSEKFGESGWTRHPLPPGVLYVRE